MATPPDARVVPTVLLEHELLGEYTREQILAVVPPGTTVDNGYSVYEVKLATDGDVSWGTIVIPTGDAPARGWDIVGNDHGTTGIADVCALHGQLAGAGLAGYFGGRGLIGVAVDYPGLDTPGLHPYLVSRSEGAAALDGLRAARELAAKLGVATSGRYALAGLSQGGHATLAAAALHDSYAKELDIRAFAVAAPATVWSSQWSQAANIPGWHLTLFAMMFRAWGEHYSWPASPPVFTPEVLKTIDDVVSTQCMFPGDGRAAITESLPTDPTALFDAGFLAEFSTNTWDEYDFVGKAFAANAIGPYTQTAPLRIYQGDADEIVPKFATDALVAALEKAGNEVDYVVVPAGTHTSVAFGFLGGGQSHTDDSIAWLRGHLDR